MFDHHYSIENLNEKWFIDHTNVHIPIEVKLLLQLGEKFCVPPSNHQKDKILMNFIKQIEKSIEKCQEEVRNDIRSRSVPILRNFYNNQSMPTNSENVIRIKKWLACTKKFITEHPDILFTKADKGNTTVAISKYEYLNKMELLLSDRKTYEIVPKDPTNKIVSELRSHLIRWKDEGFISGGVYYGLLSMEGTLPRAYGLPKIHKDGCPLRIIVSYVNSPLYKLSTFLHNILQKSFPEPFSYIENNFQLVEKMSHIRLERDYDLISLDVISLFTNVPTELAVNCVSRNWHYIKNNTSFSLSEFTNAVRFILNSTFFKFNEIIYKQTFGTPMGSPLSPIIANIVLQDIEDKALKSLTFCPPFYFRYVDDIFLATPRGEIDQLLERFNSFHERIQFTMEIGEGSSLSFLDVRFFIQNDIIVTDWYQKPTFSKRYLNFNSHHPLAHKKGIVMGLTDRALFLSNPIFHQKNLISVIEILLMNGYPLKFIFHNIQERLKYFCHNNQSIIKARNDLEKSDIKYFTIPYVGPVSEKFPYMSRKHDFRLSFSITNSLRNFITVHKDSLDRLSQCNVVYKISCCDCDATYVGQTKRQLKTKVKEHRNDIKRCFSPSVISRYRSELNHDFDWNRVEILDEERSYCKRLTSEMLLIKRQKHGLNKQSDTESLPDSYSGLLGLMPPIQ